MSYTVSAIVPAHNEERRIGHVLDTLLASPDINEIICINDGSQDGTLDIIRSKKDVVLINLEENKGKAFAVVQGILKATGDIIVFIDADLIGLSQENIHDLVEPLKKDDYEVSIGYRSAVIDKLMFMPLAGERAYFRKDLLPHTERIKHKGYGMELYLNYVFRDKQIKLLGLKGVKHMMKYDKQNMDVALRGMVFEFGDILKEVFRQKRPFQYFFNSYLYPFYIKLPKKKK